MDKMSKLEELIQQHCPDGVAYKKLKDVSVMQRGTSMTKAQATDGDIPVISGGREPAFFCDQFNREGETITVAGSGAGAGYVQYWDKPIFANDCFTVAGKEGVSTKYLYYCLANQQQKIYDTKKGGGVPHVHISDIDMFEVPLPALPVQREIVRILDEFSLLSAELAAELAARKQQYEHYRDELLTFKTNYQEVALKDLCENIIVPMRDRPKSFTGDIPWCRIEDIEEGKYFHKSLSGLGVDESTIEKMNLKVFPVGTVICSCSASLGTYAINTQPLITNQTFIGLVCGGRIKNTFLRYYMETQTGYLRSQATTGTIPYISRTKFENMKIKVPSLEDQERIVNILDKFDAILNDISEGLPAEIEARQKQYEYYRDKLLTFKRLES